MKVQEMASKKYYFPEDIIPFSILILSFYCMSMAAWALAYSLFEIPASFLFMGISATVMTHYILFLIRHYWRG